MPSFPLSTLDEDRPSSSKGSSKQIMRSGEGSQKLILLLCITYLLYAMPTSVTLGPSSDTVYLFSYSHTPVSENFPRMCSKKVITCSAMVNNLRDLWLKSQFYNKGGSTLYQGNTCK